MSQPLGNAVVVRAFEVLGDKDAWCPNGPARRKDGRRQVCPVIALHEATLELYQDQASRNVAFEQAIAVVAKATGRGESGEAIVTWNEDPSRIHDDVVALGEASKALL